MSAPTSRTPSIAVPLISSPPSLVELEPAVDVDRLAGDVARQVTEQELDDAGDVVGLPEPLQRQGLLEAGVGVLDRAADELVALFGDLAVHRRFDDARADGVDPDLR